MKLLHLKITNFKGIRSFELPLNGDNAIVSGTNGAGKTSLFDAYTWLLFGKDSAGRSETNFEVKPFGSSGLTVEVVGKFEHDGKTFTLGKTLAEKFAKVNGENESDRKPKNEYTYFIDGVPKPKAQYTAYIADICPEETFRLLSDPDYFAGKTDWRTRRKMLLDYFGSTSDRTIIRKHENEIGELITLIGCKSVLDYKIMSQAERKKVITELEGIPARVDEAEKAKPTEMPRPDDGAKMGVLTLRKKALEQQISDIENGVEIARQRGVIAELQADFATERAQYSNQFSDRTELTKANEKCYAIRNALLDMELKVKEAEGQEAALQKQRETLLAAYYRMKAEAFDETSTVCPTCGREYPDEKKEELRQTFHRRKAATLEENQRQRLTIRDRQLDIGRQLEEWRQAHEGLQKDAAEAIEEVSRLKEQVPPPFEETVSGKALKAKIEREQEALLTMTNDKGHQIAAIQQEISGIDAEIKDINTRLAAEGQVAQQNRRITQLKTQAKELGKRRAELEHGIELAERFEQIKLTEIEESVNGRFAYAKFKLFNRQINGGVAECCEVTVNGIPYTTNLNTAAKANAGLDIINVISREMGMTAPIWLDGAESVVKYLPVEAQTIQLAVDGGSEQLRVYVEE